MNPYQIQNSYRQSSIAGASPIGLVIALYDALTADLRRAADALRRDDIEMRCTQLSHAALILGQLEDWVDQDSGEELAGNLKAFYGYLRAKMLQASLQKSAPLLEEQIELVLQIRTAWQQRDATAPEQPSPTPTTIHSAPPGQREHIAFSQSA